MNEVPAEYLRDEYQTDESALKLAKERAGIIDKDEKEKTPDDTSRFEEITEVD